MTTITGLTAERMLEIEAASVVDGDVVGNDLILARQDGSIINAGNLRGPAGPTGPMGSALAVVTAQQLLDVGQAGQIRAGRQLTPADFTNMGLSAPLGLWNLSNANDSSGNARHLTIKGGVPFAVGINGLASTAAQFVGSAAQALYIDAAGGSANFNLKVGTFGAWTRTLKRGTAQQLISKDNNANTQSSYVLGIDSSNVAILALSGSGTGYATGCLGVTDLADDRWHFVVGVYDGTRARVYVDGVFENQNIPVVPNGIIFAGSGPLNIGNRGADSGNNGAAGLAHNGRIDEAFITSDVLSEEQIRNLYCASIPHALGSVPSLISMSVRRKRRGGALSVTDFPSQPLRLYNFVNGVLTDQGSHNVTLVNNGGAVAVPGADGKLNDAYNFVAASSQYLSGSDAGLPTGAMSMTWGGWLKTVDALSAVRTLIAMGTTTSSNERMIYWTNGQIHFFDMSADLTGPFIADGLWHHIVGVYDPAAADGLKEKLYVDGRLVISSTNTPSTALTVPGGANTNFRIGQRAGAGSGYAIGQIDGVFVHGAALTADQIRKLYDVGSQALAPSPKVAADHIETIETGRLLATFDTIETSDAIDLAVMA